jgi:hypothetical protein
MKRVHYFCRYCGGKFFAREFWRHCAGCASNPKNAEPGAPHLSLMGDSVKSQRKYKLKKYGLTEEMYEKMLAEQDGKCAICRNAPDQNSHPNQRFLSVDHDHTTGRVRGLLCANCNHMIGKCHDDPALLIKAVEYLTRYQKIGLVS